MKKSAKLRKLRKKKAEEEKRKTAPDKPSGHDAQKSGTVHVAGLDRPRHEKRKEPELEKWVHPVKASGTKGSSSAGSGRQGAPPYSPIGPRDTLGDINYKSYTEESRGEDPHQPPWGLKKKDTFLEFAPCRDWLLNSIPPGEVDRQRARTHSALYLAYVVGEANTRAANHQIVREWRTMVSFDEEKAKFEADRKAEEWGREGLKGKLRAAEELLAKEKAEWKKICERDNQRAYAARTRIVELEGKVADLTTKVEDAQAAQAAKEQAEVC
ncbi:hypothetical protein Hanom_Chr14g01274291 [Helianthus anomalus]